jgi:hypothetical protein
MKDSVLEEQRIFWDICRPAFEGCGNLIDSKKFTCFGDNEVRVSDMDL